jgi:prepilin-type processing-associated H-X9-DG protein
MENVDLFSTHLKCLTQIFEIKGKVNNVIEFGMGYYSTDLLLQNSINLISIEMQSNDCFNTITTKFNETTNWTPILKLGASEYTTVDFPKKIDLAFVDGHVETRPECVNLMGKMGCPIIIAHDTEALDVYGWNRVNLGDKYKSIIYDEYVNWTTLWTTDMDLYNKLKK